MKENRYALMDDPIMDEPPNLHVSGTIPRKKGLEFWMSQPRPEGVSIDEWEDIQQAKWARIFKKEEQ